MIKFSLSPLRLVLLAACGSLIILGGAIAGIVALWQPRPLESMLPGQSTIALFSNVTREDLRQWGDRFPELRTVPGFNGRLELGMLDVNGSHQWVLSSPREDLPLPQTNGTFRGQAILVSHPDVMSTLTSDTPRLKTSGVYRELSWGTSPHASRITLQTGADAAASALPPPLRPFIHASGGVLLSADRGTAHVRIEGTPGESSGSIPSAIPRLSPPPDVTLALAAPAAAMDLFLDEKPETERMIRRGQLLQKIEDVLGGEWSWEYDILPLLTESAVLHWRTGTGSMPSFAFQGRIKDAMQGRERLSALHETMRSGTAGVTVSRSTFEHGFTSTIIGSGPSEVRERRYSLNSWTVRETTDGDRTLLSAVRGRDIVIGNRKEWVENIIAGTATDSLPTLSGSPAAGGVLSPALVQQLTANMRGQIGWMWMSTVIDGRKPVLWSVETDRNVLTLSIRNEK